LILYADTSSLFKLYLAEEGSSEVRAAAVSASQIATSVVAYAETRIALARALREGRLDRRGFATARGKFEIEWSAIGAIDVTDEILGESGDLGDLYPIRAFDAIHLASAKQVRALARNEVGFSSADGRLRDAAVAEGFALAP
jgi:predicted nucleic acid-binding protein